MAGFVHDAQNEFWQSPARLDPSPDSTVHGVIKSMADACADCGTEYLTGARFCHSCGTRRLSLAEPERDSQTTVRAQWLRFRVWARPRLDSFAARLQRISVPAWLRYLHFHEIQRRVGLPTGSLIAFIIGLGCVAGAIGVSFFYKASNLAEFQAIQMWRMEWLLAATASFVAGILLKSPSDSDRDHE